MFNGCSDSNPEEGKEDTSAFGSRQTDRKLQGPRTNSNVPKTASKAESSLLLWPACGWVLLPG